MADWYVATTGNDSTGTGAIGAPYATIAKAATRVAAGDTINVADGNYQGSIYLNAVTATTNTVHGTSPSPITLLSTNQYGAKIKALSSTGAGSGNNAALEVRANYWIIDGLEIDGSGGYTGAGTTWTVGGTEWYQGVYLTGTNITVRNCKVHDLARSSAANTSGGSGIPIDTFYGGGPNCTINNNLVYFIGDGTSGWGLGNHVQGIYNASSATTIYNNVVHSISSDGIENWHGATGEHVFNNTVFNCNNGILIGSGDGGATAIVNVRVFNNICYDNKFGITEFTGSGGSVGAGNLFDTNMAYGNATANWSLSVNTHSNDVAGPPGFVNYQADGSGDYHLTGGSNAVDAGLSTLGGVAAPTDDFEGTSRPQNSLFDLGAFELTAAGPSSGDGIATGAGTASAGALLFRLGIGTATGTGTASTAVTTVSTSSGRATGRGTAIATLLPFRRSSDMVGVPKSRSALQAEFNALFASDQAAGSITPSRVLQGMLDSLASMGQNDSSTNVDALTTSATGATARYFPADLGWYKVTDYGAAGDGREDSSGNLLSGWTDNLTAFQAAFTAAVAYWKASASSAPGPTILVPGSADPSNPTIYVVSGSFRYVTNGVGGTTWQSGVTIQGSGYCKIRFPDFTFLDTANIVPLVWVASQPGQGSNTNGAGNSAFSNYLFDLVVDIGVGNPGAAGVAWIGNNIAGMENVIIRSSDPRHLGFAGIYDMTRYAPGPCLFKNVLIDGFSHGLISTQLDYSMTMTGVTFINQLVDTIENGPQMLSIEGTVVPNGLNATSGNNGLIINADKPTAHYTLPVQHLPTPAILTSSTVSDYYSVITAGADKTGVADSTTAIQAAIDSGHAVVYFPFGIYRVTDTLIIRGSVRHLMFAGSSLATDGTAFARSGAVTANFSQTDGAFSAPGGTWNPSDKATLINLTNGNLTATGDNSLTNGNYNNVRGTVGKSTGKWKYSYTCDFNSHLNAGQGNWGIGLGTSSALLGGNPLDFLGKIGSFAYYASTGKVMCNNVVYGSSPAEVVPVGATVDVYVDYDAQLVWVRPSGLGASGNWNNDVIGNQNPLTGTGGLSIASISGGSLFPMWDTGFDGGGSTTRPVIRFSGTVDCLIGRVIIAGAGAAVGIEHNSTLQLSLRHVQYCHVPVAAEGFYRNSSSGTGNLFIEDANSLTSYSAQGADIAIFHPQNVWARQLNPEKWATKILNAGGNLWILGLKIEKPGTNIKTTTGGRTEVLGYYLYPLRRDSSAAAFEHTDTATGAYAGMSQAYTVNFDYDTVLLTPGKTILHSQVPSRGFGTRAPMGVVFG